MARLPALISDLAAHDVRERSTIQLIARLVREAGWIQTTKRGRGAAEMTAKDAAALLIGVCVTDNPSQAANLTEIFLSIPQVGSPHSSRDMPSPIDAMTQAGHLGGAIVAEEISRLGRDAAELMSAGRRLRELGVVICTPAGGVIDGLELAIRAQMAQEYAEEQGHRVKRGQRAAAEKGRAVGGVAYGYRIPKQPHDDGINREVDPDAAKMVFRICKDLAAGMTPGQIVRALNREGARSPDGKLWRSRTIVGEKRMLFGIARNPLVAGYMVYGKTNTQLISSSGKVIVSPAPIADQIVHYVERLKIIDAELWGAVQDALDGRYSPQLNRRAKAKYLHTSKTACGVCGTAYVMVAKEELGCDGRRHGNGCSNGRRVRRRDLETAVLAGLSERVLKPSLLSQYLLEYRSEMGDAVAEQSQRSTSLALRMKTLDEEIANVLSLARKGAGAGSGAALLNQELERLGEQRKLLDREARNTPAPRRLEMDDEAIVARMRALLADLPAALEGSERDATRARDTARSFIDRLTITPIDPGGKADARGGGPVRVTVDGSLSTLLELATTDRLIQGKGGTSLALNQRNGGFSFYVDIYRPTGTLELHADVARFSRLLHDADAPITRGALASELDPAGERQAANRARMAITHLRERELIRPVWIRFGLVGWVWVDRHISDEQWREQAAAAETISVPAVIARSAPPEAHVVQLKL